jgi:hypothetical protein
LRRECTDLKSGDHAEQAAVCAAHAVEYFSLSGAPHLFGSDDFDRKQGIFPQWSGTRSAGRIEIRDRAAPALAVVIFR